MKNVLITGATGYIGSNLIPKLIEKYNVHIIIRKSSNLSPIEKYLNSIKTYYYDGSYDSIRNAVKSSQPDVTIHLATYFVSQHTWKDIEGIVESNIKFGLYILEALKEFGYRNFINTGTYWQHFNSSEYDPVNLYAASKEAFHDMIKYYESVHNFSVLTLLLSDVYGPNDKRPKIVNLIKDAVKTGKELKLSEGKQYLDLIYIDDVVEAYTSCIGKIVSGIRLTGEYTLTSGEPITLQELVYKFSVISGANLSNIKFGELPYRIREIFEPIKFGCSLPFWRPKTRLEEGLRRVMEDE
ncbi:MAG TPA: NAD(P)-dependent oxidoreductase [Fervidobacterium nodosum]|nr:NAD(P)-dependent oxidoreductase [Fervidobacterium nodosum]